MSKGLIYCSRPITGVDTKTTIHQMKFVKGHSDEIHLLSNAKTDAGKIYVEEHTGLKISKNILSIRSFYHDVAEKCSSWEEVYAKLDVEWMKEYDNLYLFYGMFSGGSNLKRGSKRIGVFPKDSGQIRFQSIGSYVTHVLALLKANREYGIPLHEIVRDPLEFSLNMVHPDYLPGKNYHLYFAYDIPKYGMKRLDTLQNHFASLKNNTSLFDEEVKKEYDFVFGFTIVDKNRIPYYEYAKNLALTFDKSRLFIRNVFTGEDTFIDRDEYLKYVAKAKYCLILPAYDTFTFSIHRLIEVLSNDCLPLIHSDCNLEDVQKSFDVDLTPLVRSEPFDDEEYAKMLAHFKTKILKIEKHFL